MEIYVKISLISIFSLLLFAIMIFIKDIDFTHMAA